MTKTNREIYGPVLEIIRKLKEASQEETDAIIDELEKVSKKAFDEFENLDKEFVRIHDANIELEEKIKSLNELLDKRMAEVSFLDLEDSMIACSSIYKSFWTKLDEYSQKYLAMANYLFKLFSCAMNNSCNNDVSPSILEFGRAVENELIKKIYYGYILGLCENSKEVDGDEKQYKSIKNAVKSYKKKAEFYIPARDMIRYLSYLSTGSAKDSYVLELKAYLEKQHIDVNTVSDSSFTSSADELFDKYRNVAAHSGGTMTSDDASTCREKTKKVLKKYMSAVS